MLNVEQFVYTTASTSNKQGYQIIAKSSGVTDIILEKIDPYLYPIGISPNSFTESKSLVILEKEEKMIFSKIYNIGIGYDGRNNTLYNHSLVMSLNEFQCIDNDTRMLEEYYFKDYDIRGELPKLKINSQKNPLQIDITQYLKNSLREIVQQIFNNKKIAIVGNKDVKLLQQILGFFPPSMRQISFSTMVASIEKQSEYKIIMSQSKIKEKFHNIDVKSSKSFPQSKNKLFEEGITHYVKMLNSNDKNKIQEFFDDFDRLSGRDYKNKLVLLSYVEKLNAEKDEINQQNYEHVISEHLKKFEPMSALEVFNKIRNKNHQEHIIRIIPQFEIQKILNDVKNDKVSVSNIEKMLNQLKNNISDSRLELLYKLVSVKKEEFLEHGAELLVDARYVYYKSDIYRTFVENYFLHKCIFDVFESNSKITQRYKKQIFETIFLIATKNNPQIIMSLLNYDIYDLTERYEVRDFKDLIKNLVRTKTSLTFDFELIFGICHKIFSKIQESITKKQTSGILEITDSTKKELAKTAKMLKEFIDEVIKNKELTNLQKNRLIHLRTDMEKFVTDNYKAGFIDYFYT